MATPNVGLKAFTARCFGVGLGLGFGSGVWFVDSMFITNSNDFKKSLNHYNAFIASVQKTVDCRSGKFKNSVRNLSLLDKKTTHWWSGLL